MLGVSKPSDKLFTILNARVMNKWIANEVNV